MFRNTRIKYASKCGRVEHKFGRVIAIPIIIGVLFNLTVLYEYLNINNYYFTIINMGLFIWTLFCWAVYLLAHTLEKKIYGKHGFR